MGGSPRPGRRRSRRIFHLPPMLTMLMSIAHRITGTALYFGTC